MMCFNDRPNRGRMAVPFAAHKLKTMMRWITFCLLVGLFLVRPVSGETGADRFGVPASAGGARDNSRGLKSSNALPAEAGTPNPSAARKSLLNQATRPMAFEINR